ncbi:hypothetical protein DGI_0323 [Megalodesulfovibrio gigas DSM 1382 = ATCC 19364]|uniref:Uncharacterized protein n=1 Tax=Megalodesulfovibrio gigas (strain ATCC 19364 / DSM 1382 / NCIMB 9332 / VKM B-1759) TaxID=1121448 RepID=T2G6P4_MEGG1|nr:hypothetical protein DGI_0323 [Megalodesulfovibrio gigas DSM 1382 = ATCC 19364]
MEGNATAGLLRETAAIGNVAQAVIFLATPNVLA